MASYSTSHTAWQMRPCSLRKRKIRSYTLQVSTSLPVKIYLDEGIAQFIFLRGKACRTSYADRNGKYQNQEGITLARV